MNRRCADFANIRGPLFRVIDDEFGGVAGVFFALFMRSMQRVKKLDKFEKMI